MAVFEGYTCEIAWKQTVKFESIILIILLAQLEFEFLILSEGVVCRIRSSCNFPGFPAPPVEPWTHPGSFLRLFGEFSGSTAPRHRIRNWPSGGSP